MKTIFVLGIEQFWVHRLRETYDVVVQREIPATDAVKDHIFILTSDQVPPNRLHELRRDYPEAVLLYHYKTPGVRGYANVCAVAETHGIHFLAPRATVETVLQKLEVILKGEIKSVARIVGFFGSGMGIGVTSVAATFAAHMAAKGQSVVLLGLDLYHPGWYKRPSVSLDRWQPRLTGRVLQVADFATLPEVHGFRYLPGNYDFLAIQQYQEDEIEFLIEKASEAADVVLLDCGSVPESAGWYVGMQRSGIRFFVTHPAHEHTVRPILDIVRHLDLQAGDFQLIINRSDVEGGFKSTADLASEYKMLWSGVELPTVAKALDDLVLPLGKKETTAVQQAVNGILRALGIETPKKGGILR